jgi:hypothetical protein
MWLHMPSLDRQLHDIKELSVDARILQPRSHEEPQHLPILIRIMDLEMMKTLVKKMA